jgi:hemerythrin-like domain-containing protein
MSALMSLTDEHQMISELLGAFQTYAVRLRSGASVDPADLARFSEALRELVDYRHHEKEEGVLLPFLARNGFEWSTGLLAELRFEHGHLRYLIDVLSQAAAKDSVGQSREGRRQIAEAAAAFIDFKRRHIQKEEHVLLPAVRQRLSSTALEQLGAELRQFDRATGRGMPGAISGAASRAPVFQQVAELVQRYSEDSGTVDVTGVQWVGVNKPGSGTTPEVAAQEAALRARREVAGAGFTSSGRSR